MLLYYDAAEVVNPLGSSTTIHKIGRYMYNKHTSVVLSNFHVILLGLSYYTLGNLEPRFRSPTNAIQC